MNKIQVLIDNGFITLNEVLTYAYNHHALEELNSQVDDYEYTQMINQPMFEPDPKDIDYESELNDSYVGPDYDDDYYDRMFSKYDIDDSYVEELRPKYVVASTNSLMEETMVFTADEHGDIISYGGLNSIALRYGNNDWRDAFAAVNALNTDEYKYIHIKKIIGTNTDNVHNLFMRITAADNVVI